MLNKNKKRILQNIDSYNKDLKSVLSETEESHYLIIIADRKKGLVILFKNGDIELKKNIMNPGVRKSIRINSGELYGRSNKLAHHIDNQLRGHLQLIIKEANNLIIGKHINGIFIGGHKPLFGIIVKELSTDLQNKIRGEFITELNIQEDELIKRCQRVLKEYVTR